MCHEVMGPDAIFIFWMWSFKPPFSLSSFNLIKFFSSSSLSAFRMVSFAGLRLLIFLWQSWFQLVSHPAQHFAWCTLHVYVISCPSFSETLMSAAHTHCLVFYFFLLITSWRPFVICPNRAFASFATCASYLAVGASYTVSNWSSADEHWGGARFWLLQCCKDYLGANVSL